MIQSSYKDRVDWVSQSGDRDWVTDVFASHAYDVTHRLIDTNIKMKKMKRGPTNALHLSSRTRRLTCRPDNLSEEVVHTYIESISFLNMGNKASAVLSAVKPGEAISNVNKQLGLEEDAAVVEKKKAVERGALKKERDLRQQERVTEFRSKQVERDIRKASLQEKWNKSRRENS